VTTRGPNARPASGCTWSRQRWRSSFLASTTRPMLRPSGPGSCRASGQTAGACTPWPIGTASARSRWRSATNACSGGRRPAPRRAHPRRRPQPGGAPDRKQGPGHCRRGHRARGLVAAPAWPVGEPVPGGPRLARAYPVLPRVRGRWRPDTMTDGPGITGLAAAVAGHRPGGVRTISTERDLAAAACCDTHARVYANGHLVRWRLTAAPEAPDSPAIGRKPTVPLAPRDRARKQRTPMPAQMRL